MFLTAALALVLARPIAQGAKAPATAPVPARPVLASLVPKDAFFLVQATSLDGLRADFESSAWYALYQDDEMKGLRGWVEQEVGELQAKFAKDANGLDPLKFFNSVHGALGMFGSPPAGKEPPTFGFLVDPGDSRGAFDDFLQKLHDEMTHDVKFAASTEEYAGVEMSLLEPREAEESPHSAGKDSKAVERDERGGEESDSVSRPQRPSNDFRFFALFEGRGVACMLAAPSREALLEVAHGVLDLSSGKDSSGGLEGSPVLAKSRASAGEPGRLELFLDLGALVEQAKAKKPPDEMEKKTMDLMIGTDGLGWLYGSADVGKGEAVSFELGLKIPEKGYFHDWIGLLGRAPKELAVGAPRECLALSIGQLDVWGLWQSVWKLVADVNKEGAESARAQMEAGLAQVGAGDLEKSLLSQIDGRFLSFNVAISEDEWKAQQTAVFQSTESEASGSSPTGHQGTAIVLGLRDVQSVSRFVEGVLKGVGAFDAVKTEEFQGSQIHRFSAGAGSGVSWAFLKQGAVFSQSPTAIRAALRMETADRKDSALEKDSFKPLYDAHADASLLSLATTAESLKSGLAAIETMRAVAGMGGMGVAADNPLAHLPSAAAIDRHFKGTTASTITRSGGVLRMQISSR